MAKLSKSVSGYGEKIAKIEKKLAKLEEQKTAIEVQIKGFKTEIAKLKEQETAEKGVALSIEAKKLGLTMDDILAAVSTGDFFDLQDKIEQHSKTDTTSEDACVSDNTAAPVVTDIIDFESSNYEDFNN
jgi:predicted  nucleic acid-binding Zn-ribbon protein